MKNAVWLTPLLLICWAFLALGGVGALQAYGDQPGEVGSAPAKWPAASKLPRGEDSTLLVFFHPECSCSRATASELERLLAQAKEPVRTIAVFLRPKTWSDERLRGSLWSRVAKIHGVEVIADEGPETQRFGAKTSGFTTLYDAGGRLAFFGGITGARGHEGDNLGRSSIVDLLNGRAVQTAQTSVFGCGLFESVRNVRGAFGI